MCIYQLSEYASKSINEDNAYLSSMFHDKLYYSYVNGEINEDDYEKFLDETDWQTLNKNNPVYKKLLRIYYINEHWFVPDWRHR